MNILHLQNELNYTSGVAKYLIILFKNLSPDFKNHLIIFKGYDAERFKRLNIEIEEVKKGNNYITFIKLFFKILNYCRRNKIEIIHSHHRFFDLIAFLVSKFIKVKTIMTVHSIPEDKKYFSYKSHKLIAVSNAVKIHLLNKFNINESRIKMKYNPVDEEEVYPDESLKKGDLNIPEKLKIISYFGRFDYEKGFDIYISAVKEVLEKRDDIFFLFAGSGEAFHLADVIKNSKNVKFIQPQYKIKNYLNISDFIILASRRDPFPYLMLEAGILRKIFIGASVDGIAEFIEDKKDGLLFIPEDKNSLINKIIYAVDNYEEVKIFGNNLYKKVRENCSVKNYITFIENLYLSA